MRGVVCVKLLTAVYDLSTGTIAYDFITWLVRAKLEQQRRGADCLHVILLPHTEGLGGFARHWGPHDEAATRWRLWNIVIAACPLADATVTLAPTRDFRRGGELWEPQGKSHLLAPLVQAAKAGEKIPLLKPSTAALRWASKWTAGGRCVTLTLRNNGDERDSSPAWAFFYEWLLEHGWMPLLLQDTADALQWPVGSLAALSIDLRAALYVSAAMNCFTHNGPMVLAWHTGAPLLAFNAGLPGAKWRESWEKNLKLKFGEQLPWALENQRLIYQADDLPVLREAFNAWSTGSS